MGGLDEKGRERWDAMDEVMLEEEMERDDVQ